MRTSVQTTSKSARFSIRQMASSPVPAPIELDQVCRATKMATPITTTWIT